MPVPADVIYPIVNSLIEWGKSKHAKMMISMSGIPIQDRQDAKELKTFAAASSPDALKLAQDKGIEVLTEGYMVGPQAVVLQRAADSGPPALTCFRSVSSIIQIQKQRLKC
jgi:uncharacterized protein